MYLFTSTFTEYCCRNNTLVTHPFRCRKQKSQVDSFQGNWLFCKGKRKLFVGIPLNRKYLVEEKKEISTLGEIITSIYMDDIAETNLVSWKEVGVTTGQEKTLTNTSKTETKKYKLPEEVRRKISMAMIGRKKSKAARAAMSMAKKGMVSPNKGHKLTIEARARLSLSMLGRRAWNKGRKLSMKHKVAISNSLSNRSLSQEHRQKLRVARLRPTDRILSSTVICSKVQKKLESSQDRKDSFYAEERQGRVDHTEWPLLTTQEINEYVSLRRELRVWSEKFSLDGGSTPSMSTLRRKAPKAILKKYEKYLEYRERFRGLAFDVYGKIAPGSVSVSPRGGRWRRTQPNKCSDESSSVIESSPPELLDSSLCHCEEIQKYVASNPTNHASIYLTPSAYRILGLEELV
ncbi:hypothetical protein Gasu2_05960 [Galdieria sulphuraria]|nr:hypothetical protein Gasu2_05960 [Galdieria sulphuraria]